MKAQLFKVTVGAFNESAISMPGFSHWTEVQKTRVHWYPWEEWTRTAYLFARNRSHAAKQLERAGLGFVRDLVRVGRYECPEGIFKAIQKPKTENKNK